MSLVDGEQRPGLPSMSWDSVVDGADASAPDSARPAEPDPEPAPEPVESPGLSLSLDTPAATSPSVTVAEPAPVPAAAPPAASEHPVAETAPSISMPSLTSPVAEAATPSLDLSMPSVSPTSEEPGVGLLSPATPDVESAATTPISIAEPEAAVAAPVATPPAVSIPSVVPDVETPAPVAPTPTPPVAPVEIPVVEEPAVEVQPVVDTPTEAVPEPAVQVAPPVAEAAPPVAEVSAPVVAAVAEVAAPVAEAVPAVESAPDASVASSPQNDIPVPVAPARHEPPPAAEPSRRSKRARKQRAPKERAPKQRVVKQPVVAAPKQRARKDRSGGIARFVLVVLVLAAVGAAGVVFGRPYLFPSDWDADVAPYAESVAAVRGVEFVEPVTITDLPTAAHVELVADELFGSAEQDLPMWRALGLAGPDGIGDAELLLDGVNPAVYSTTDGQIYVDEGYVLGDRDARITRAIAVASIDQQFTFSNVSASLGLDDRALVDAHVRQQSAAVQRASDEAFTILDPSVAPFAYLPPVLDYRLTAPYVFNELLPVSNEIAANPLGDLTQGGPGPLHTEPMVLLTRESQVEGDQAVTQTVSMDRSFWFLVFASHLDSQMAYEMSNSIEQSGLQSVTAADGSACFVATFSGGNSAVNAELTSQLVRWSESTAVELGSTVTSLPDSGVQLRSCDPTGPYTSAARFGVARDLLGWRAAELALTTAIIEMGGTDETVAAALPLLAQSDDVIAVTALPEGTSAVDLAGSARAATQEIADAVMQLSASTES